MRTYVKFDGKDAVPEWVEDCFECISEPAVVACGRRFFLRIKLR